MTLSDLTVTEYRLEGDPYDMNEVALKRMVQREWPDLWKITRRGSVLGKDGKWHHEPIPSSRTVKFLKTTRWESAEDALAFYQSWRKQQ